jgi:hypothetical protein
MANRYLAYVDKFVEYKEPTYNLKSLSSKSSQRVFETLNKDVTASNYEYTSAIGSFFF